VSSCILCYVSDLIQARCARLGPAEYNMYLNGQHVPSPSYHGGLPNTFGMTRAAHETLVRRLVVKHCSNVQFFTGTVIGVDRSHAKSMALGAVNYRSPHDSVSKKIMADLVAGT
jgi:hypothetical protein